VSAQENVFKTSSRRQRILLARVFPALIEAIDEAVPVVVDFLDRELRQNSVRFFFATIMT